MVATDTNDASKRRGASDGDVTRRELLQYAGLGMAALGWSSTAHAKLPIQADQLRVAVAIYDPTLAQSRAFASQAKELGVRTVAFNADPVTLWQRELAPALANGPATIIGMTRPDDYFVIDHLTRIVWARTHFAAAHDIVDDSAPLHRILIDKSCSVRIGSDHASAAIWPRALALQLCSLPSGNSAAPLQMSGGAMVTHNQSLISWAIAPRATSRISA